MAAAEGARVALGGLYHDVGDLGEVDGGERGLPPGAAVQVDGRHLEVGEGLDEVVLEAERLGVGARLQEREAGEREIVLAPAVHLAYRHSVAQVLHAAVHQHDGVVRQRRRRFYSADVDASAERAGGAVEVVRRRGDAAGRLVQPRVHGLAERLGHQPGVQVGGAVAVEAAGDGLAAVERIEAALVLRAGVVEVVVRVGERRVGGERGGFLRIEAAVVGRRGEQVVEEHHGATSALGVLIRTAASPLSPPLGLVPNPSI